jgi:predicted transcriptional regulator
MFFLRVGRGDRGWVLRSDELLAVLMAVGHTQRLRIIGELASGRVHVSELARRLGLSRPLLYMHLERMEKAGLVAGHLELSADGKAMKFYELAPFDLRLTVDTVLEALREDERNSKGGQEDNAFPQPPRPDGGPHDVRESAG